MTSRDQIKLYSYVIKNDKGLAPNPFWEYCTLAVCTPNHMGVRAEKDDWFMGTETIDKGNKLIYTMQVDEILPLEKYYNDPRFEKKKPIINGKWYQQCGDNMYYKNDKGEWKQHPSIYHCRPEEIRKDLKHPYVFISKLFYYFGDQAVELPPEYQGLLLKRQGCKYKHDAYTVKNFLEWLQKSFQPGKHGEPSGRPNTTDAPITLIVP